MSETLLRWLGVDPMLLKHWADVRLLVRYPSVLWLAALVVPVVAWFVASRHRAGLATMDRRLRGTLTALRVAVFTLALAILSCPYLSLDKTTVKRPVLAVVVDQTRSMDVAFGPAEKSPFPASESPAPGVDDRRRVEVAQMLLERTYPKVWRPLVERFDVRILALRNALQPLADEWSETLTLPAPPKTGASRTKLGDAVVQLIDEAAGQPMAGIVLLTDGQNTGGASLAQASFAARRAGAPVFGVPIGNEARVKDIAIADVFSPGLVSKDDSPRISVSVQSQGFDDQVVEVVLKEDEAEIERKPLRLNGKELQHLDFTYRAEKVGVHVLAVEIEPRQGEALAVNNRDRTVLRVTDDKLKVLLVDGVPRWDFRFLRNAMTRDRGLAVETILESEVLQRKNAKSLPTTAAEYKDYAVVVLGDVSTRLLTAERQKALVDAVRKDGLGLVIAAGPQNMPNRYVQQPLEPLLPVVCDRTPGRNAPGYDAYRLELTPSGRTHEVTRLYDEPERNEGVWSDLPPYYWCGSAVRIKPGALPLVVNRVAKNEYGPLPIVAFHQSGDGGVLYVGTDSTWGWRQNVGDRYFYKFWGQSLRFVARRPGGGARLEVSPLRISPGDEASFVLRGAGAGGTATVSLERTGNVENGRTDPIGAGTPKSVQLLRDGDEQGGLSRFSGRLAVQDEGRFRATYASESGATSAEFVVVDGIEEFQHPEVNRSALEALSRNSGGRLVEPQDLDQIPPLLHADPSERSIRAQQDLWDKWPILVLVAALYCLDVGIRRWTGLS